ncbi:hypothetical protein ACTQ33_09590 [Candidatus Avoscillospira sp. LCP25S3_F1]|uniref:hypothetical protein n=1 Tax=Candidatus Avoscillospira sp. LCP25S3_F1 TaxID=3438825 RepID=UPI003F92AA38
MVKALLRARFLQLFRTLLRSGRKGKQRTGGSLILYALLMLYVLGVFCWLFGSMADTLCMPLYQLELDWLYFALMAITAVALGVVGSIFSTKSQLFEAKDNEMLLAMPIPPKWILLSRMVVLYVQALFLVLVVMVPAAVIWQVQIGLAPLGLVFLLLTLPLLPLLSLVLSCLLGWLVALLTARMAKKNIATVLLSLAFMAAYFYGYTQINELLQMLLANGESVAGTVQKALYPFYQLGLGCLGSPLGFLLFALCALASFAVVYALLSRSFASIVITHRSGKKIRYREKPLKVSSVDRALLRRELKRLWNTPSYLLNGCLGSLLLVAGSIYLAVQQPVVADLLDYLPQMRPVGVAVGVAAVAFLVTVDYLTCSAVSLDGKTLWLAQSLPITPWQGLRAKLRMGCWITMPPVLLACVVLTWAISPGLWDAVLLFALCLAYCLFHNLLGLVLNLLMPRLDWESEAYAIKNSGSVMAAGFGEMALILCLGFLTYFLWDFCGVQSVLTVYLLLLAAADGLLYRWLRTKGAKRFSTLS